MINPHLRLRVFGRSSEASGTLAVGKVAAFLVFFKVDEGWVVGVFMYTVDF